MTRSQFMIIRKRHGKIAELRSVKPCPECGEHVQQVVVRKEPKKMYFVFDAGPGGEMHRCLKFLEVVNAY